MQYYFSKFKIDTKNRKVSIGKETVNLTKQNYDLLEYLLKNSNNYSSKQNLVEHVWKGRVVAHNTIDKSITKLKSVLNTYHETDYFKTQYGVGIKLIPRVSTKEIKKNNFRNIMVFISLLSTLGIIYIYSRPLIKPTTNKSNSTVLLLLPSEKLNNEQYWWTTNQNTLLKYLLGFSQNIIIKNITTKPTNLNKSQFLQHQWKLIPHLLVLTSNISKHDEMYTIVVELKNKQQTVKTNTIKNKNFSLLIVKAADWVLQLTNSEPNKIKPLLLTNNRYETELYLRAVKAQNEGEIEKAQQYFEMCLIENPQYHIARLDLIAIHIKNSNLNAAIQLIDKMDTYSLNDNMQTQSGLLRSHIFSRQQKYGEAQEILLDLLINYTHNSVENEIKVRKQLIEVYLKLNDKLSAFKQLNSAIVKVNKAEYSEIVADLYYKRAYLLQINKEYVKSSDDANQAKTIYRRLGDISSEAKATVLLAKIARFTSHIPQAMALLKDSLAVFKATNEKSGIISVFLELIELHLWLGQLQQAQLVADQLNKNAIEFGLLKYQIKVYSYYYQISIYRKYWDEAQQAIDMHLKLATLFNNSQARINNEIMQIDLLIEQNNFNNLMQKINNLQVIDSQNNNRHKSIISRQKAAYFVIIGDYNKAKILLDKAIELAINIQNKKMVTDAKIQLTKLYIIQENIKAAKQILMELEAKPIPAYPYLLLKSKMYNLSNDKLKALEFANQCKNKSGERWHDQDEKYLTTLIEINH